MKNKFFILLVFWWSMIFPSLSYNNFTTDITDKNISYSDLYSKESRKQILQNAEYDLWIKTIFLSSDK